MASVNLKNKLVELEGANNNLTSDREIVDHYKKIKDLRMKIEEYEREISET